MPNQDRMTIYMNEQDKAATQKLIDTLVALGIDLKGKGKKSGTSELFRYLVQKELKKVAK